MPPSAQATTYVETPIYESVLTDLDWQPDMLREPFDLNVVIARSYDRIAGGNTPSDG